MACFSSRVAVADRLVAEDAVLAADDGDGAGDVVPVHEDLHAGADRRRLGGAVLAAGRQGHECHQQEAAGSAEGSHQSFSSFKGS